MIELNRPSSRNVRFAILRLDEASTYIASLDRICDACNTERSSNSQIARM